VVTSDDQGGDDELPVFVCRPSGSKDGMLRICTIGTLSAQVRLKFITIFPQVMEQAGEISFGTRVKCCGKVRRELGDVFEMRVERLPFAAAFRQAFAFRVFGGVGVSSHTSG
jgi:hypothetical protein